MRTSRTIIGLAALLAVLLVAGSALAAGPKGARAAGADPYARLTPEKQAAVEKIFAKHKDKLAELHEAAWDKQTELSALVRSGKAERKDIQDLVAEIGKLRKEIWTHHQALRDDLAKETGIRPHGRGFGGGEGPCGGGAGPCGGGMGPCGGMGGGMGPCGGGSGPGMGMGMMGGHRHGSGW